jgi:ribosome production factor 2
VYERRTATTARGRRYLNDIAPKLVENAKVSAIMRASECGRVVSDLLNDIYTLKKPLASNFLKKETDRPFDDTTRFEKICKRNTCGLFVFGSRTKSHPTRLVFGRTFDEMLMDMIELDVSSYVAASTFKNVEAPALGAKPLIVFQGPSFSHNPQAERLRSMLLDSFRGASPQEIALESVQHTIVITAVEKENTGLIFNFRVYRLALKKTGSKLPFADLVEMGPRFDFKLGRERLADFNMLKAATAKPKAENYSKIAADTDKIRKPQNKNITTNALGQTIGKIHVDRQDMSKLYTPHHNKRRGGPDTERDRVKRTKRV